MQSKWIQGIADEPSLYKACWWEFANAQKRSTLSLWGWCKPSDLSCSAANYLIGRALVWDGLFHHPVENVAVGK